MSCDISDVNDDDEVVSTWAEDTLVVSFNVRSGNSYDKTNPNKQGSDYVYFGFDWVKLNNNGEITHLRDISINKCSHVYEGGSSYVAANDTKVRNILKDEFKIFKSENGSSKKYSSQAWIYLPRIGVYIDNLKMKLDGIYQGLGLSFEIPVGITLEYKNGSSYVQIQNSTPVIFTNSDYQMKITANSAVGKVEINVKNQGGGIIGSLGVFANAQKQLDIYLCPVIENPGKTKTAAEKKAARNAIMYNSNQQALLKEKLDRVFHQVGINVTLLDGETIEYDPSSALHNGYISNKIIESDAQGKGFFEQLKKDNTSLDSRDGINLMIADAKCEYSVTMANGSAGTGSLSGLGTIGKRHCIIFDQARTDYGVCSHEIGHTLGLIHAFYESDSDIHISDKEASIKRLEHGLIDNPDPDDIEYINIRLTEEKASEKILFKKKETKNLMDYNSNNFNYLFKWQWNVIHTTLRGKNYELKR